MNTQNKMVKKKLDFQKYVLNQKSKVYQFFASGDYNFLVMELLGQNIEAYFLKNVKQQQRTIKSLEYAQQMLERVQSLHQAQILHRDIKPENFVFGINQNQNTIYLVDFGLSKKFMKKGNHIPMKEKQCKPFMGTQRFASLNVHNGKQQSRRDDLQSLLYTILFLIKGSVPWQIIKNKNLLKKREQIKKMKQNIIQDDYLDHYPQQFQELFVYVRKLAFQETPNYEYIKQKLKEAILVQKDEIDKFLNSFSQFQNNQQKFPQCQDSFQPNTNLQQNPKFPTFHKQYFQIQQYEQIQQIEVEKHQNLIKIQKKKRQQLQYYYPFKQKNKQIQRKVNKDQEKKEKINFGLKRLKIHKIFLQEQMVGQKKQQQLKQEKEEDQCFLNENEHEKIEKIEKIDQRLEYQLKLKQKKNRIKNLNVNVQSEEEEKKQLKRFLI